MSGPPSHYRRSLARFVALAFVAVLLSLFAGQADPATAARDGPANGHTRLDSQLVQIVQALRLGGLAGASAVADQLGVHFEDGAVRVIIEARPGLSGSVTAVGRSRGATVEDSYRDLVQALVPVAALEELARSAAVQFVRPPLRALPMVTGEGVSLINADDWQAQGISGAGVKVAVLDLGFQGYEALLGSELPGGVTAMSFRADGDIGGGTPHGTAVAEIVHEVAPGAQLYLVNFDTEVELASASQWLTDQGVQVVNASWGYFVSGPGDGTGPVNDVVAASTASGVFWSVAAANHAQRHWSGTFRDSDGDLFHEFRTSPFQDEGNELRGSFFGLVSPGETIGAELKWDDPFGAACQDYNLYLKRTDDSGAPVTVAASENVQNDGSGCLPGADPVESLLHEVQVLDVYHLVIKESVTNRDAFLHLYSFYHDTEYVVSANSLGQPADNAGAMAVGAVNWCTPGNIEPYSSRGPTTDGRTKPDVVGPDGVSNVTYPPLLACSGFSGTSAASPHIAAAAALVRGLLPCYTPTQLQSYLEAGVVDLGAAGKDSTFGSGRVLLGTPPPDTDADALGDACDPDDDNDGFSDAAETFLTTDPLLACGPNGWPPDIDGSGAVEIADVFFVSSRFGAVTGDPDYAARAELASQDGAVGIDDVFASSARFGQSCGP